MPYQQPCSLIIEMPIHLINTETNGVEVATFLALSPHANLHEGHNKGAKVLVVIIVGIHDLRAELGIRPESRCSNVKW